MERLEHILASSFIPQICFHLFITMWSQRQLDASAKAFNWRLSKKHNLLWRSNHWRKQVNQVKLSSRLGHVKNQGQYQLSVRIFESLNFNPSQAKASQKHHPSFSNEKNANNWCKITDVLLSKCSDFRLAYMVCLPDRLAIWYIQVFGKTFLISNYKRLLHILPILYQSTVVDTGHFKYLTLHTT